MKRINTIILGIFVLMFTVYSCKKKEDAVVTPATTGCGQAPPTASYNGPVGIGDTLKFKAQSISGATYSWKGPKNFSSNLQNPTRVFATGFEGDFIAH